MLYWLLLSIIAAWALGTGLFFDGDWVHDPIAWTMKTVLAFLVLTGLVFGLVRRRR